VQDRGVEGREREVKEGRPRLVCRGNGREGDKTVYYGARPGTAKLTISSNSPDPILQCKYIFFNILFYERSFSISFKNGLSRLS
jgi:hypothetical protein